MNLSIFDIYTIGIGPSSSHVVGPMRAARLFASGLDAAGVLGQVAGVTVELFGSLAFTGAGHGTNRAIILGLVGATPEDVDPDAIDLMLQEIRTRGELSLLGRHPVPFNEQSHLLYRMKDRLPYHTNGMRFTASGAQGSEVKNAVYYSVGGGFVVEETAEGIRTTVQQRQSVPYPFESGDALLDQADEHMLSIPDLVMENEKTWRPEAEVRASLLNIWNVMQRCVERGIAKDGYLPGRLQVERRAPQIHRALVSQPEQSLRDPLSILDWVNLYAFAVNEENAAGGRVVTAPTNGAAGILPAVLHYYQRFCSHPDEDGIINFLLTAGAIALLYKKNASISGAEVGCQGEVGVACSMAAAGLTAALGGSNAQIEEAAEIGMEHNLGLTCDPVGGLVQIPCIERNAMAAVKAINASRLALRGDGLHIVSLDHVIATMHQTGLDMKSTYKETSLGGLAVNVVAC
ncbi:MAG: L-serine ammonia-lyase [Bacteroidetes bacterium]|nr:L-serine ammonia-lyase [Bacteroidota bacterium]